MSYGYYEYPDYLQHHGIPNMKWGVRRFQNKDGSLTPEGKLRYGVSVDELKRQISYRMDKAKLGRLEKRADVDYQKKKIQSYDRRAKVAAGVGVTAAGVAVGSKHLNNRLKKAAQIALDKNSEKFTDIKRESERLWKDTLHADRQAYTESGKWTGKGYSESTDKKVDDLLKDFESKWDANQADRDKIKYNFNRGAQTRKTIATVASAVSAASLGYAAYNVVMGQVARKRITEAGHKKALEKYQKHYDLMKEKYADFSVDDILKLQKAA